MQPRPSGTIILDIDEAQATEDTRLEVKRCYPHVGNALVRTHKVDKGQPHGNTIALLAMVNKEYMDPSEESQQYWDEIMERWVHSLFYNLGNAMKIYNRRQREIDGMELYFDYLNLELQNREYTIQFALDSNSDIKAEAAEMATKCRNAMVSGALGEGVTFVSMPSPESYRLQFEAGQVAKAQREEAKRIAAEEAAAEEAAEEERRREEAEENFLESPEEEIEKEKSTMETWEEHMAHYKFPEADFEIDFRFWSVTGTDGAVRQYDSETGMFVESCA